MLNRGDITSIIKFALSDLFQEDSYLLYNDVSEWSICGKLAWHLLENLKRHQTVQTPRDGFSGWPDLTADIEFNRNRGRISKETRRLPPGSREGEGALGEAIPDIVLHERGTNRPPKDANLLAVEVKKADHQPHDKIEAKVKVVSYVAAPLYYRHALYLSMDTDEHNPRIEEARLITRDEYEALGKPHAWVFGEDMHNRNLRIQDARARPVRQSDCSEEEEKRRMEGIQDEYALTLITDAIQPTTAVP